jgi:hypothetical protein
MAGAFTCVALAVAAMPAYGQAVDPRYREEQTWITLQGTVTEVEADEFTLDYGSDSIVVEFDDGDDDADARRLVEGDQVSVSGVARRVPRSAGRPSSRRWRRHSGAGCATSAMNSSSPRAPRSTVVRRCGACPCPAPRRH